MSDHLTTLALCWRVERRDGVAIGLTDHDRDLTIDGIVHRAAPGMVPSAIARSDGLDADTMEVAGALSAAAIGERDLLAGRWDGARVVVFAVDWRTLVERIALGEGTIGAVEIRDGGFSAELRGVAATLDRAVVETTSPDCRAELGDRRCRVAMAGRRRFVRVVACDSAVLTVDTGEPVADAYGGGLVRWMTGANSGLESAVASSSGTVLTLYAPARLAVGGGGSDRTDTRVRQDDRDVRDAVCERGEFSRGTVSAGYRPADALSRGMRIVAGARGCIGAAFRAQGREPARGLDCVGVVAVALRAGGYRGAVPAAYAMRSGDAGAAGALLRELGLRRVEAHTAGDVLLMAGGPGQLHLGVWTGDGIVHADAMLRRVVERPGTPAWPVIGVYRLED